MRSLTRLEMTSFRVSLATKMRLLGRKSAASIDVERSRAIMMSMPSTDRSLTRAPTVWGRARAITARASAAIRGNGSAWRRSPRSPVPPAASARATG